jgi:hypothetical protein
MDFELKMKNKTDLNWTLDLNGIQMKFENFDLI